MKSVRYIMIIGNSYVGACSFDYILIDDLFFAEV